MRLLRKIFPPKSEVWRPFCEPLGGRYVEGGLWTSDFVEFAYKNIPITLTAEQGGEDDPLDYTKMRSTVRTNGEFMIGLSRNFPGETVFASLITLVGLQKLRIPALETGTESIVLANDIAQAKAVLDDPELKDLINGHPQLMLFLGQLPKFSSARGAKGPELVLSVPYVIKDLGCLQNLLRLHEKMLERLFAAGVASAEANV